MQRDTVVGSRLIRDVFDAILNLAIAPPTLPRGGLGSRVLTVIFLREARALCLKRSRLMTLTPAQGIRAPETPLMTLLSATNHRGLHHI